MKNYGVSTSIRMLPALVAGAMAIASAAPTSALADDKFSIGVPGVPPVFISAMVYTAKGGGFYKKYGLDVTVKPFNSGVGAAKAVLSGSVDASISPTAPVARMISNGNVPLVAVQGY